MPPLTPDQRANLRALRQDLNDARRALNARVHTYRNILVVATFILLTGAVVLPLIVPYMSSDIGLLRPSDTAPAGPTPAPIPLTTLDIATVEVWGVVGGLVGLIVALRNLNSSRHPVRLQLVQLMVKLPAGAITAIFGVILMQAGIIPPLKAATIGQLAAYAVLFGFAQEAITTFVDRQANRLLDDAKSPTEKSASSS